MPNRRAQGGSGAQPASLTPLLYFYQRRDRKSFCPCGHCPAQCNYTRFHEMPCNPGDAVTKFALPLILVSLFGFVFRASPRLPQTLGCAEQPNDASTTQSSVPSSAHPKISNRIANYMLRPISIPTPVQLTCFSSSITRLSPTASTSALLTTRVPNANRRNSSK